LLTCKEFLGWLNDCLDNTADAETKAQVQKHVSNCPNCWVVYDTTKKTLDVYKGDAYRSEPQPVPDSLKAKLLAAIQGRCAAKVPKGLSKDISNT
jgi:predicted anti-sigma-YlaC factor YlaD